MVTPNVDRAQPGWRFWLLWMGANIAGVIVFMMTVPVLYGVIGMFVSAPQDETIAPEQLWIGIAINLISSAALGAAIGLAQWLVLRRYLSRLGWWVLATMIGYALPLALGPSIPLREPPWLAGSIMFLMFGATLGILQWLVLRGRVYQAGWWIALCIGSWLLAFALTGIAYLSGLYVEPFDLLAAFLVPVAVAGAGIVWLLRRPAPSMQAPS
jgi:hypothetical protein